MRSDWNAGFVGASVCIACGLSPQLSRAAPPAPHVLVGAHGGDAEAHSNRADMLVKEGKYEQACPLYELAQGEDPSAVTLFDLGDCYEHTGQVTSAWKRFVESAIWATEVEASATDPQRRADAREHANKARARAEALASRRPMLSIVVEGRTAPPDLVVKIDRDEVHKGEWAQPLPVDPGDHEITAAAAGRRSWSRRVHIAVPKVGESPSPIEVKVPELDIHIPTQKKVAMAVGGIAAGGLLAGAAFGIAAFVQWEPVKTRCADDIPQNCSKTTSTYSTHSLELEREKSRAHTFADVSTGGFVVAGVAGAAALTLWLTAPSAPSASAIQIAPAAGPTGVGLDVRGRF